CCDRHSDACGHSLSQWTGCRLHPRYPVVLRMARRLAVELAKTTDIVQGNRGLSEYLVFCVHGSRLGQVKYGPEQHRGMAVRQDKAIAVGPDWIFRIETEYAVPDGIDKRCKCHRRARPSGFRLRN